MDIQEAINLPNIAKNFGTLELETGTQAEQLKVNMEQMGHKVRAHSPVAYRELLLLLPGWLVEQIHAKKGWCLANEVA